MAIPAYLMDKTLEKRIVALEYHIARLQAQVHALEKELKELKRVTFPKPPSKSKAKRSAKS